MKRKGKDDIDTGATHSFISLDCTKRLDLKLTSMIRSMVIDIPSSGLVTTSLVCLKCLVSSDYSW